MDISRVEKWRLELGHAPCQEEDGGMLRKDLQLLLMPSLRQDETRTQGACRYSTPMGHPTLRFILLDSKKMSPSTKRARAALPLLCLPKSHVIICHEIDTTDNMDPFPPQCFRPCARVMQSVTAI
ncbi:unnamed protein product [Gadus morhua 'NCC']